MTKLKPLTEKELNAAGFVNAYDFYGRRPYVQYGSQSVARTDHPVWWVTQPGVKLSDAWYNFGSKVIWVESGSEPFATRKAAALAEALRFATKTFKIKDWVKGPYGSYGSAAFIEERTRAIRESRCRYDRESGTVLTTKIKPATAGEGTKQ